MFNLARYFNAIQFTAVDMHETTLDDFITLSIFEKYSPGNDIDMYLEILVDELKQLWEEVW